MTRLAQEAYDYIMGFRSHSRTDIAFENLIDAITSGKYTAPQLAEIAEGTQAAMTETENES